MNKKILIGIILFCIIVYGVFVVLKSNKTTTEDNKVNIVTSFYPMYIAAMNLTEGASNVELINLTKPTTGCLHDYQLSTDEMIALEKADIFIINGAGMESFIEDVVKEYPNLKVIYASEGIDLIENEDKEELEYNPHVWVSINKHINQIENITKELIKLDVSNKEIYTSNSSKYINSLNSKLTEMKEALKQTSVKDIITFHEAFPYFAEEFGLNIVSVIEREPGTEPSATELAETIDIVKNSNVKALFAEPQYTSDAASVIANETEAKVYYLDPAVTGELNKDAYLNIMSENLKVLLEALK